MIINGFTGRKKKNENKRFFTVTSAYKNKNEIEELKGSRILVEGLDKNDSIDQIRTMLSLRGFLDDGVFYVENVEDISLYASTGDLLQLSTLVEREITTEALEILKKKLEKISLSEITEMFKRNVLVGEKFTSAETVFLENLLGYFAKNGDFNLTCRYLKSVNPAIDYPVASVAYSKLYNRAKHNNVSVYEIIKQNPYVLAQVMDYREGEATAKKITESWDAEKSRVYLCASRIIKSMLENESNGNCFIWLRSIYGRLFNQKFTFSEIQQALDLLINAKNRIYADVKIVSANRPETREMFKQIATESYWPKDKNGNKIPADKLHALYFTSTFFAERKSVENLDFLSEASKWETGEWDKVVAKLKNYDEEQKEFLLQVPRNRITVLTGNPGSGKTTILKQLVNLVAKIYEEEKPVVLAPTALAAHRAASETVSEEYAATIHRYAKMFTRDEDRIVNITTDRDDLDIDTNLIIIDEASMLTPFMFARVLKTVKLGTNIVIAGDNNQLPPVGTGGIFPGLIRLAKEDLPNIKLIELKGYYRGDPQIKKFIDDILAQNTLSYSENIRHEIVENAKESKQKLLDVIAGSEREVMILTPYRNVTSINTQTLNLFIQKKYNPNGEIVIDNFRVGDNIVAIRNDYKNNGEHFLGNMRISERPDIYNGMRGIIKEVDRLVTIEYRVGQKTIEAQYNKEELPHCIELAYVMTVHKMQGAQGKHIVFVVPDKITKPSLFYTAVSRCSEYGIINIITKKDFWQPAEQTKELSRFFEMAFMECGYLGKVIEEEKEPEIDWGNFEMPVNLWASNRTSS